MVRRSTGRTLALIVIFVLAAVALLAMGTVAEDFQDWRVSQPVSMRDQEITVAGNLRIDDIGSLHLTNCTLRFTGGEADDQRLSMSGGSLVLERSTVISDNGGLLRVEGHLELQGETILQNVDVWVGTLGTLAAREASLTLVGSYTSRTVYDPVEVQIGGSGIFSDAQVVLRTASLVSTGTISFAGSSISSSHDFGWVYVPPLRRVAMDSGTASLVDSTFEALEGGFTSQADTSIRDCQFKDADLELHIPDWQDGLSAWVDGCTLTDSQMVVSLANALHRTKELDILVEDLVIEDGILRFELYEAYKGSIVVDGASITRGIGYAVEVRASGIDGDLVLESLDIESPWGILAQWDYSGMRVLNSTVTAEQTALVMAGEYPSIPAYVEGVTLLGPEGISATSTVVKVTNSDLSETTVPVKAEEGSAVTLTDCTVDESAFEVNVEPDERSATIKVDRHLTISNVRWSIGDPITEGTVLFYVYSNDTLYPIIRRWDVGSSDRPLIRLMEWTRDGEGFEERLVFDDMRPYLALVGTTFESAEAYALDPWEAGPFVLVFVDEVSPWLSVSGMPEVLNQPSWLVHGTCGDEGTGIDQVHWFLYTPEGELVSSGEVDILQDGRWQTLIEFTGAGQTVQLMPVDRSGNEETVPLQSPEFALPTPTLTVARPEAGLLTNVELVTVSGTADFFASEVHVQVLGHTDVVVIPVVKGHYSRIFRLPQEGLNDLVISSHDNFTGFDEKRLPVYLDTIAPAIVLEGLEVDSTNHVNNPSLVISGTTDDPRTTITVLGQELGLVERAFATTVSLAHGRQTIKLVARDEVGNVNVVNLDVVLDTTAPTITLVDPAVSPFWSKVFEVEVLVDVDEAVSSATINGEAVDVVDGRITYEAYLTAGTNEYAIQVIDLAGNEASRNLVMRVDTEEPTLVFVNPRQGQVVNTTAVPLVVTTSESGCSLFLRDGEALVPVSTVEQTPARLVGTMYLTPGEGERTVVMVIVDRAGHTSSEELTFEVDTVAPFLNVEDFHDGMKVTTEPLKVRGWTEAEAKVVWVNGQMASLTPEGRFSTTIELEEGWQDVRFLVLDRAGNSQEQTFRVKALGEPQVDPPVEALAVTTILVTLGALAVTTEVGRWTVLAFFIPLYTKLRKDKILDQRTRGLIQGYITANPGCNYTIIRDNLDLADGTLTYHLQVLEREGFVYSIREGLFRCFYPQGVPPPRRGKLHLSDVQADIVRIAKRIPGITVGEIATAMNRRPNVISYHLKLLKEGGLIRMEEDGRHVRVYAIDSAVAMI